MSLDNVLAIAVIAHGNLTMVVFGIALSIPIVVFGSAFVVLLMNRFAWIVWLGGGVLGYYAAKLILKDPVVSGGLGALADALHYPFALGMGGALTVLAWWFARRQKPAESRLHG